MRKFYFLIILCLVLTEAKAQFMLNEASNANGSTLILQNGTSPDWIEIYNTNISATDITGWGLSDERSQPLKWKFPPISVDGNQFLMVYANDNNSINFIDHMETAVFAEDTWSYTIPHAEIANWNSLTYNSTSWASGQMSIGYGDDDDATMVSSPITTIYSRISFVESDISVIKKAILDIDYDDGFVAYLNGVEIARSGLSGVPPAWDETAVNHEALIYQGGSISSFEIPLATLQSAIVYGTNVLAIELHNTSASSTDMTCIPYLTFGYDQQGTFHSGTVHQYFLSSIGNNLEANFGIISSGETIYLSNPAGIILDSIVVPDLEPEMSCGKKPDGSASQVIFSTPTPNASNNSSTSYIGYEAQPTIVNSGGVFPSTISVSILNNSTSSGILRYTTDGTTPETSSPVYSGPISLSSNSVIKAICFPNGSNLLPSIAATETFLFQEDFSLPIILLTVDDNDLYGASGIFDNYWTDWKKPCVMEYFDKDGVKKFESRTSVKIDGGAGGSRSNPQHSMTIEPGNSTFGEGEPVHYPIIPSKPYISDYYTLYLRNGSNYWNQYPQKDATMCRIMQNTNVKSQAYTPAVVFLNGEYFGIYEVREKTNEGYFENNYGNDLDSLDLLSVSYFYGAGIIRTVKGSDTSYYNMRDFIVNSDAANDAYFEQCNEKLDLYNFTDYIAGENWFANTDWIYNNMKIARPRTYDNKWKFLLQDLELGLGGWTDYNQNIFEYFRNNNQPNSFWDIYNALIQNEEFKNYFINRFADLMNTTFQDEYYQPIVDSMYDELLVDFPRHLQLWTGDVAGGMQAYSDIHDNILYQFANRNAVVRSQIVNEYSLVKQVSVTLAVNPAGAGKIKISTIIPESLPWSGVYFDGNPVVLTAIPNPGYTFVNWQANTCIPSGSTSQSLNLNISSSSTFRANFSGTEQDMPLTFSEINYHSDSVKNAGDWIEIYNPADYAVDISDWYFNDNVVYHKYLFATGTEINPGEYIVLASDSTNFSERFPDIQPNGYLDFDFSNTGEELVLYDKFDNPVVSVLYDDSIPWPKCADGYGRTLELRTSASDINDGNNWFGGCIEGSPDAPYSACNDAVIFNEINYNSSNLADAGDWIEIHNTTANPVDVSGFSFIDGGNNESFYIPSGTVIPGYDYIVLYRDNVKFTSQHPLVTEKYGPFTFGLSSSGELLCLYDNSGGIAFSMIYDISSSWPQTANGGGYTLEYDSTHSDFSDGTSWFAGCPGGSPASPFIVDCTSTVPEEYFNTVVSVYPNPANEEIFIEYILQSESEFKLYDILGSEVKYVKLEAGTNSLKILLNDLNEGMYLFDISDQNGSKIKTGKLIIRKY